LVAMALQEMPLDANLFQQASRSADLLDETGLEVWDAGPPYPTGPPSDSVAEKQFTRRLVEVMHGRRTRLQTDRQVEYNALTRSALQEALVRAVSDWEIGTAFVAYYEESEEGHREREMAQLWVQWLAREAHAIYCELGGRTSWE
ncbi:hypothetical protein LshimejAT787_3800010, partial [Lyophyllum shimeji]